MDLSLAAQVARLCVMFEAHEAAAKKEIVGFVLGYRWGTHLCGRLCSMSGSFFSRCG